MSRFPPRIARKEGEGEGKLFSLNTNSYRSNFVGNNQNEIDITRSHGPSSRIFLSLSISVFGHSGTKFGLVQKWAEISKNV